jgi:hypothetical protein
MIRCKGRNGWFKLNHSGVLYAGAGLAYVFIESKQKGDSAPLIIEGTVDEVKQLLMELSLKLEERFPSSIAEYKIDSIAEGV